MEFLLDYEEIKNVRICFHGSRSNFKYSFLGLCFSSFLGKKGKKKAFSHLSLPHAYILDS